MARGWNYTKPSLASAPLRGCARACTIILYVIAMHPFYFIDSLRVSVSYLSFLAFFVLFCFISVLFVVFTSFLFSCSPWSFVNVPLILYSCPASHVQYRIGKRIYDWVWLSPDRLM